MSRAEKVREAQRLRAEGLLLREIADRMDCAITTVSTWLSDPDRSKEIARKNSYRGVFVDCGAPTDGSYGRATASKRCLACAGPVKAERNERIFAAWDDGDSGRTIAEREGMTETAVQSLIDHHRRRLGRDLQLHRHRNRELWPVIERRWNEGATPPEIAAELDTYTPNIWAIVKNMRAAGIDLPRRRR